MQRLNSWSDKTIYETQQREKTKKKTIIPQDKDKTMTRPRQEKTRQNNH